ncbi:MAG: sensor domain-containing diguanylate cyclase [Candidatus Omnitrophota bacterium]
MCKKKISLLFVFFVSIAFIGLPLYFTLKFIPFLVTYAFLAYLIYFVGFYAFYLRKRNALGALGPEKERLQEAKNVSEREVSRLAGLKDSLHKKIKDYRYLEKFTENLNNETSLERICDIVVDETFGLFGAKGNCLLYLISEKNRKLELRALKKEDDAQKIREKMGDFFDQWALRHNQPLLVEQTMSDFRFDPDRIKDEVSRPLGSLISVPLVTETNTLGVLRIDSPDLGSYHADDLRFLSVIADISKLAIENAIYFNHMQALSITDGLTGIYLRRYALERLKEEFLRAQREDTPLSFLMLDIDNFKNFNDEFGHMGGDVVLKKLSRWLNDFFVLPGSLVGRFGGEEFCVILPRVRKIEAIKLAESFRGSLEERDIILRRQKVSIHVSLGVSGFPEDAATHEDLIRYADDALFKAKRSGRNRVCF